MTQRKKLEVEEQERLPVVVYRLRGVLTSSDESYRFLQKVQERTHRGQNRIVVNMDGIENLTSAGVGILAACYTSVINAQGRIILAGVPARARSILKVVHLYELMGDAPSEEEGVEAVLA